jgi:hypothetical protein
MLVVSCGGCGDTTSHGNKHNYFSAVFGNGQGAGVFLNVAGGRVWIERG